MKGLDDYITGVHMYYEDDVLHKCLKCGARRMVRMNYDMDGWFYFDDDDGFCCDEEMEIVEE